MNAGPSRRGRGYRPARKRRTRTAALTGLSAAIAATLLVALGARAVIARTDCTGHPLVVNVAAASEIGPVVRHLGQYFNRTRPQVSGHCVHVAVTAEPPGTVAAQLAGKAPHGPRGRRLDSGFGPVGRLGGPDGGWGRARPAVRHHTRQNRAGHRDAAVGRRPVPRLWHRGQLEIPAPPERRRPGIRAGAARRVPRSGEQHNGPRGAHRAPAALRPR